MQVKLSAAVIREADAQFGLQTVWKSCETAVINQHVIRGNEMTWLLLIF